MNQRASSDFLGALLDFINKTPRLGWEEIKPIPKITTFDDEMRERAIALWKQSDEAWENGDRETCFRLQAEARKIDDLLYAQSLNVHTNIRVAQDA